MPETEETRDMTVTDEHWTAELDELPPRPRRKLLTPLTGGLLAVLIAAAGFIGGVLVEKGQASGGGGGRSPNFASLAARAGGGGALFGPGGGGDSGNVTAGRVSSVEGRTLYVTSTSGGTVRVKVPVGESVSKTITTSVHAIHPGENVIVQGSKGKGGVVNATSVRATPGSSSGASGGSGGGGGGGAVLNQLFGGGGK
ncbi:MAG TPA: hypothetical protein VH817_15495 [Thermoleophilaceae bacterium]|jgi:hypothetical protein